MLILQLMVVILLLFVIYILSYSMLKGAPYAPIGEKKIEVMLSLLKVNKGEKAVDLGSGDGRIVMALARQGVDATGYEINPLLVLIAKYKIRKAGLQKNAHIHWADIWKRNLSSYDIVTIYLTGHIMKSLGGKLDRELKKGTRIAINYFHVPDWQPVKRKDTIYLYIKK